MLTEFLEHNPSQQVGSSKTAWRHMEGLRDRLTFPAWELLAHRLDHFPLARDHLQGLGNILAQL